LFSLNDSLSNFDIVPPDTVKSKIPYFTANKVRMLNPGIIRYRSVPDSADATVKINALTLTRTDKNKRAKSPATQISSKEYKDFYTLKILGNVNADVEGLEILRGFPFQLDGDVALGFDPFRFATSDYHVNLGSLRSNIDMRMQVGGNSRLDAFSWHLDNFDLFRFLSYIPGIDLSSVSTLQSIDMPLTVNATARLTSPWRLSSSVLPSAEVDFNISDGDISYTLSDGTRCALRHEGAGGCLFFNGTDPEASSFVIPPFHLVGEGLDLTLGADMQRLLGKPVVEASVEGNALLRHITDAFPFLRPYNLQGDIEALATMRANLPKLSEISNPQVAPFSDLAMDGKITMENFSGLFGEKKIKGSGKRLEIDIEGGSADGSMPRKIDFSGAGEDLVFSSASNAAESFKIDMKDMKIAGELDPQTIGAKLAFQSSAVNMKSGQERVALGGIDLTFKADKLKTPVKVKNYAAPAVWKADTASLAYIPHTSEFLQVKLPKDALDFMSQWKVSTDLKIKNGVISTPSFPARNTIRNLDIAASFDSVVVRNLQFRSRSSSLAMRGKIRNLRQFLASSTPAPLYVGLEVAVDTLSINQLAGTFLRSKKGKDLNASPDGVHEDDTIAMLLPRNIIADIRATAKETQYMNLHLYDLVTGVHLRDGNLDVKNLRIGADFGNAFLNFDFNTSDIQAIGMRGDVGLMDINVVNFFKNFHTLLLMMPQMKNLEGEISAEADFSLLSFPNMYVNIPSLGADIRVQGDGLTVHQSPFIRHITRMLLIRENGPLHIADMNVHASLHDNLLELYPFTFSVDRYRLRMGGLNNFDGDLYYHIGVEKSPIPFPFGINVVGKFSHPDIRFGGAHWKIKKGEEITSSVMEDKEMNIMAVGRKFLKEFLRKAADSE
ncbi:MAG: AsmA-like C-terminal region-containing protein, partial [Muribaculaceae bacterium]|nr:AsmA-like C-terminal region-containing protein [Muribaculaceae bacterium]